LEGIFKRRYGPSCSPFIYLLFLSIEVTVGDRVIEVHRCCCPGGLLGGLGAGRGRLGGILEREREFVGLVVLHFFPLFAFASRSPQAPEVHYCCCLGGLLGGLVAGRGGFGGPFLIESCFCSLPFVCSLWLSWVMRLLPSLLVGGWLPTPGRPRCNVTRWGDPFFHFVDLASATVHCV